MESIPPNQPNPPAEEVLQTILHKPYEEIKAFSEWLKENTLNYIIGEHEADLEVKTTHCHILIEGLKVTRESLRKQVIKHAPGRGQNCTMSETQQKPRQKYNRDFLAIYIIKGKESVIKSSTFTEEHHADWASKWIDRTATRDTKQSAESKEEAKDKKDHTIWATILRAKEKCVKHNILKTHKGEYGDFEITQETAVEASCHNWQILCQELNKDKIRTSRNELERAWVTLLRQDSLNQQSLYEAINKNVFR